MTNLEEYLSNQAEHLEGLTPEALAEEIDSVLYVHYIRDYRDRIEGVRLMLTCGGPTVWLDTDLGMLIGMWGPEHRTYCLSRDLCDSVTEHFI